MVAQSEAAFKSNLINKTAILIGATALAALSATAAHAQNYPWCSQYSGGMGGSMNCGFSTYAQCMENVSGIGGFCMRNDTYQPPQAGARRSH